MGSAIALRENFDSAGLQRLAKASKDAAQSRRLLALAEINDGGKRLDAARIGGCCGTNPDYTRASSHVLAIDEANCGSARS